MLDRRHTPRWRPNEIGSVAVDEHTSLPCILYDFSLGGVRLTMPGTSTVPETFVLTSPGIEGAWTCLITWRDDETIGAQFHPPQ